MSGCRDPCTAGSAPVLSRSVSFISATWCIIYAHSITSPMVCLSLQHYDILGSYSSVWHCTAITRHGGLHAGFFSVTHHVASLPDISMQLYFLTRGFMVPMCNTIHEFQVSIAGIIRKLIHMHRTFYTT